MVPTSMTLNDILSPSFGLPLLAKTNATCSAVSAIAELLVYCKLKLFVCQVW